VKDKAELRKYIKKLTERIEKRVGKVEDFLEPMIETTARHQMIHDKIWEELMESDLVVTAPGSTKQLKQEVNPLLSQYEKMHRSLQADYTALGLTYNTMPKKMTDNTRKDGMDESDPMALFYKNARNIDYEDD
jgi:hypothetical protein